MPTLLNKNGFRFFFWSNEGTEPPHVHVTKGDAVGKVWLEPVVEIVYLEGFSSSEERILMDIIRTNEFEFKKKWHEHFNQ